MSNILISLIIGIVIAIIDTLPMIIKKLDLMFIISAFTMWVIVSVLSCNFLIINSQILNGLIFSILLFIPLSFLIYRLDPGAFIQVIVSTIVLGLLVGLSAHLLIK